MSDGYRAIIIFCRHELGSKYRQFIRDLFDIQIYDFREQQLYSWKDDGHRFWRYQIVFAHQPKDRELEMARQVFPDHEPLIIPEVAR
jgi:hypothetical protein